MLTAYRWDKGVGRLDGVVLWDFLGRNKESKHQDLEILSPDIQSCGMKIRERPCVLFLFLWCPSMKSVVGTILKTSYVEHSPRSHGFISFVKMTWIYQWNISQTCQKYPSCCQQYFSCSFALPLSTKATVKTPAIRKPHSAGGLMVLAMWGEWYLLELCNVVALGPWALPYKA